MSSRSKFTPKKMEQFKNGGGWEIVYQNDIGQWRGTKEAAKKTGLSAKWIYNYLKSGATKEGKTKNKYESEFENDKGIQAFELVHARRKRYLKASLARLMKAWKFLGQRNTDGWDKSDYTKLFNHGSPFFQEEHDDLKFDAVHLSDAQTLRDHMRANNKANLLDYFKGEKYLKGSKINYFLEADDVVHLCEVFVENESLIMTLLGVSLGARHSSLVKLKREDINFNLDSVSMVETKVTQRPERWLLKPIQPLLLRYIEDYKIQPTEPLFAMPYSSAQKKLSAAGRKIKLGFPIGTHTLKHTFVSQAYRHGVSAEMIVEQTGTDWETLKSFYRAKDDKKARKELFGEVYDVEPFYKWYEDVVKRSAVHYERIKKQGLADGFRGKLP